MAKIIERTDSDLVKEIDKSVKNRFKWEWLEKKVELTIGEQNVVTYLGEFIRKVDVPGQALCVLCSDFLNYGSRGRKMIEEHINRAKHIRNLEMRRTNYSLPSTFKCGVNSSTAGDRKNYGVHPMFKGVVEKKETVKPVVPISDRLHNAQAMVLGVIAENNLPLKTSSVIIDLAKELAKDKKMLDSLSMDRTTASYRMTYGLAKTIKEQTLDSMHEYPFSLNIDESTSNNHKRILAVLVSFYSVSLGKVLVEHLTSLEVINCNSQSLYDKLSELFEENNINWKNLVSILMDSCAVMRGSKSGLETRIRTNKAPHLLNIDGDVCHHVHNACKKFCSSFGKWVESLFTDLHNDIKWSPDLQLYLSEICELIGIKYCIPERFISHRWLSVYDLSVSTLIMLDALVIFYYAFLPKAEKSTYHGIIVSIYRKRHVSLESRDRLREILQILSDKKLTDDGKARKARITKKLHFSSMYTTLILNFYQSSLPLLKSYVCLFQGKQPLIHLVHDKLDELFRDFLVCFIKPECIPRATKKLKHLDLDDDSMFLKRGDIFTGSAVKSIGKDLPKSDKTILDFYEKVKSSYIDCAKYLQHKLPLDNKLLESLSAIDPIARGHSRTATAMKYLEEHLPFLGGEAKEKFQFQVLKYQADIGLPPPDDIAIDDWWTKVSATGKYNELCRIVFAALSIFHGPQVESSFNTMGDIIDIRACQMKVETLSSIQTVKYYLKTRNTSAVSHFKRKDILHSTVNRKLCVNMKQSASKYKYDIQQKRQLAEEKRQKLKIKSRIISKAKLKKQMIKSEKKARNFHKKALQRKFTNAKVSSDSKPCEMSSPIDFKANPVGERATNPPSCMNSAHVSDNSVHVPQSNQQKRKMRIQTLEELVQKRRKN